jgi:LmbE family N-acetylglucosaminyl deacetylase
VTTVLAIAAHPDDEVLGCGATLARHAQFGDEVRILIMADGVSSRSADESQKRRRRLSAEAAATELGARDLRVVDFPDNRFDQRPLLDLVRPIEEVIREVRPDIIYTHHGGDLNIDHELVHRAVVTACRPLADSTASLIAAFEVLSSTEWASPSHSRVFLPRLFVDVSCSMERKLAALRCYQEELRSFPHPRSCEAVKALAAYRGAAAGFEAAEAFDIVRMRASLEARLPKIL